jgi:hypothetical protein
MLRLFLIWLAKFFPPKSVTERAIAPLAFTSGVAGILVGVLTYVNDVDISRSKNTMDYVAQFREETLNLDPFGRKLLDREVYLRGLTEVRCVFFLDELRSGRLEGKLDDVDCKKIALTDFNEIAKKFKLSSTQARALRKAVGRYNLGTLKIEITSADATLSFFLSLRSCVSSNTCDGDLVYSLTGRQLYAFLNDVCLFVESQTVPWEPETLVLAAFYLDMERTAQTKWSSPSAKASPFFCEYLRTVTF